MGFNVLEWISPRSALAWTVAALFSAGMYLGWHSVSGLWFFLAVMIACGLPLLSIPLFAIVSVFCFSLLQVLQNHFFVLSFSIILISAISAYLGLKKKIAWRTGFFLNALLLVSATMPFSGAMFWQAPFYLFLGFLFVYLLPKRDLVQEALAQVFFRLSEFTQVIFLQYLQPEADVYQAEIPLHDKRRKILEALHELRVVSQSPRKAKMSGFLSATEKLYDYSLALSSLSYRIEDPHTLQCVSQEIQVIAGSLPTRLKQLGESFLYNRKMSEGDEVLAQQIESLESLNESTLQVVANNPILFFIFIRDLQKMDEALQAISLEWNAYLAEGKR